MQSVEIIAWIAAGASLLWLLWVAASIYLRRTSGKWTLVFAFFVLPGLAAVKFDNVFSDDAIRYRWDGHVGAHGLSPYDYPPNAPNSNTL